MRKENLLAQRERGWYRAGRLVVGDARQPPTPTGKFKLTGFGRDRVVSVRVYGPNVETKFFWVVRARRAEGRLHQDAGLQPRPVPAGRRR